MCGTCSTISSHVMTIGVLHRRFLSGRRFAHQFHGRSGTVTVLGRPGVIGMLSMNFNRQLRCVIVRRVSNVALGRCLSRHGSVH